MNPFIPELNYFLAYQYCRSLGLQLVSFETKEKADLMMKYLKNTGYAKYDFWTSGNRLGTDMFLWMSTGSPFNSTFNYMNKSSKDNAADASRGTNPQQVSQKSVGIGNINSCMAMSSPNLMWSTVDCMLLKNFICEQTRSYHYNYGTNSVPASLSLKHRPETECIFWAIDNLL
ncbi:hypothetical protein TSAR_012695 [Trichomalopsis sarcophagae]|uniref:C-type lectin domain-containing protein n=1 Tax=Trichomalopsis sarcophagae TaxID=543379 RepID=A0A232ETK6_9HYME|nr:hypothetical protein TSAR_012695 [Trichomalopsis sarcophagae]